MKLSSILCVLLVGFLLPNLPVLAEEESEEAPVVDTRPLPHDRKVAEKTKKLILSKQKGQPFEKEFAAIVAMGPPAVLPLLELGAKQNLTYDQRWTAIRAVGKIGDRRAVPPLLVQLKDPFPMMRMAVLRALGDLRAGESVKEVMEVAEDDPALLVRNTAVTALGQLKSRDAIPTLEKVFYDDRNFIQGKSLFIRRHVIVAMGEIEERAALPLLIKALDDRDNTIPPASVASLERITGLKFSVAGNPNSSVPDQWKSWWTEELKRIPMLPPKESEEPFKEPAALPKAETARAEEDI